MFTITHPLAVTVLLPAADAGADAAEVVARVKEQARATFAAMGYPEVRITGGVARSEGVVEVDGSRVNLFVADLIAVDVTAVPVGGE